ncbi:potassium/sodium hyperpolarization-activated cyclic nucleotide-gated channel 2-like [Hylaeus volcanicus]|uniref:potassium/sodium hyperpolarization-activated cyclic nucleotide-gated channel 2-like n=1 Tax=Hylaeus volcanicus TaxID=313075 RepID=UPI0023B78424|nr:potassium/sodium hyperpolarization-activated cyclic nucleotide-gated channel 2-like [Hylaeus volcanicus]
MKEHVCGLPKNREDFHHLDSKINIKDHTFNRVLTNLFKISENSPRSKIFLDSLAAVSVESRRHAALKYSWIIHPFSLFRFSWDLFMAAIYLISFISIPFMVCFIVMCHDRVRLDKYNLFIYTFCWLDIVCNCITGYYDEKHRSVEMQLSKILKHYLRTFLIMDILSSLPWDHITLPWRRKPGKESSYVVVLINLLPLLKLTRYIYVNYRIFELFTVKTHFEIVDQSSLDSRCFSFSIDKVFHKTYNISVPRDNTFLLPNVNHSHVGFLPNVLVFVSVLLDTSLDPSFSKFLARGKRSINNVSSVSSHTDVNNDILYLQECVECWMTGLDSNSIPFRFQHSLFIVIEKLSASGYGLYVPRTDGHLLLSSTLMVMGRVLECFIIVMIIQIKAGTKASTSKFQEIMNQLKAYTRQKQLPLHMKNRLLAYYQYRFRNSYFREKWLLSNLSEALRQEIALQSSHRLIENVAIFKNLPKHILRMIVKNLKFELHLPNDVIVKAGAQGDCMFFLSAGTVAVLTPTGKEICHLEDGAHFGEVALLVPDQRRVASVIAIEVCEVYRLDRRDFRKCIAVHTELFANIESIATDRIERAVLIEEQHKRHLMRDSFHDDGML